MPDRPDPTTHAYEPGPITLITAHRGAEPACRVCGRFRDQHRG